MALLLENVKKDYRQPDGQPLPILNVKKFQLSDAEQVALVGSSGGGKTTLLNVIAGITA
ncbi:MAG: ATP-binding cassette domain-containing protein, partial [Planctomycetaceae bacterium]